MAEVGPLTARAGDGGARPDPVVLRRAVSSSRDLWAWHASAGRGGKRDVVVELLDAAMRPVAQWVLVGARPVRWSGPTLDANRDGVAMEEIELAYDQLDWAKEG